MFKRILVLSFFFFYLFPQKTFAAISPVPTGPVNDSTTDTPKLIWEYSGVCVSSGSCFRVWVASSSAFSPIARDHYTNSNTYIPKLTPQKWYWKVEAKDSTGTWSDWSDVWSFTLIEPTPTPTPTPSPSPSSISTSSPRTSFPTATQVVPSSLIKTTATPLATKIGVDFTKGTTTESSALGTNSALATPKINKEEVKTLADSENNLSRIFLGAGVIIILASIGFYAKSKWIKQL